MAPRASQKAGGSLVGGRPAFQDTDLTVHTSGHPAPLPLLLSGNDDPLMAAQPLHWARGEADSRPAPQHPALSPTEGATQLFLNLNSFCSLFSGNEEMHFSIDGCVRRIISYFTAHTGAPLRATVAKSKRTPRHRHKPGLSRQGQPKHLLTYV